MAKQNNKSVPIDYEFQFVLIASMRYAIGRTSYAPSLISSYIKKYWDKLSYVCRALLQRELQYEIDQADKGLKNKIYTYDPLGNECDRKTWIDLNEWMKENIHKT